MRCTGAGELCITNNEEIVLGDVKYFNTLSRTCYVYRSISSEIKGRITRRDLSLTLLRLDWFTEIFVLSCVVSSILQTA